MLNSKIKKNLTALDDLAQRRIKRKTEQMQGVKLILAMVIFTSAIMEAPVPTTAKLTLNCPLIERIKNAGRDSYRVTSQSCAWKIL